MIDYTSKYNVRTTMYQQLENSVSRRGDNPCLYYYNNMLTWNQVSDMVDKCAAALKANGVEKGDRVVICLPNMPQCIAAIYAVNKIGAVASMLHPLSVKSEADYTINLVGAPSSVRPGVENSRVSVPSLQGKVSAYSSTSSRSRPAAPAASLP